MRYEKLEDYFEIKCKKCNSTEIELTIVDCAKCGDSTISARCNACGNEFDYHKTVLKLKINED